MSDRSRTTRLARDAVRSRSEPPDHANYHQSAPEDMEDTGVLSSELTTQIEIARGLTTRLGRLLDRIQMPTPQPMKSGITAGDLDTIVTLEGQIADLKHAQRESHELMNLIEAKI